jgi:hypothetical protein
MFCLKFVQPITTRSHARKRLLSPELAFLDANDRGSFDWLIDSGAGVSFIFRAKIAMRESLLRRASLA